MRNEGGAREARKESSGFLVKKDEVNAVSGRVAAHGAEPAATRRAGVRSLR